jgi:hypothetical protein
MWRWTNYWRQVNTTGRPLLATLAELDKLRFRIFLRRNAAQILVGRKLSPNDVHRPVCGATHHRRRHDSVPAGRLKPLKCRLVKLCVLQESGTEAQALRLDILADGRAVCL